MRTTRLEDFKSAFLGFGSGEPDSPSLVWRYDHPASARVEDGDIVLGLACKALDGAFSGTDLPERLFTCRLRAYGDAILRLRVSPADAPMGEDGPILELDQRAARQPLGLEESESELRINGRDGRLRAVLAREAVTLHGGSQEGDSVSAGITLLADGQTEIPLMASDYFSKRPESLPLAFTEDALGYRQALFSLHAAPGERFAGTGERFRRMDLAGGTYVLENTDALGCNNRRSYKNVPFFLSSRPYGLFVHTSSHLRLSLADISTRAAQGIIEEPCLDLFLIGGGSWERILFNYRCLTGFPPEPPAWTYGTWMSRMSYQSADQVREVAQRLRREDFPCDVLHIDTAWFKNDWVCDWKFSEERFPNAPAFLREMREQGFRVSLWQTPYIGKWNPLAEEAGRRGFLSRNRKDRARGTTESHFSPDTELAYIDFTNPEAVAWYREELLRPLLEMGVAAIKTDFGEDIDMEADYKNLPAARLHNIYNLLYHRAAAEVTEQVHGYRMVFGRSAWAGSQRYPLHWAGDTAGSWDGLAGALRGGLHLGLSGFAFWSHDVGGFYGVPDFMSDRPEATLFLRWAQVGVFSSHLRFHGTTPREPYTYPEIAGIVRKWLKLRYSLIPYILEQASMACAGGWPLLAPLVLRHEDDPACWHLDDQYYFGRDLIVAPILDPSGRRGVYLPEGIWVDLWTGQRHRGPVRLAQVEHTLETIPLYAREGAAIPYCPIPVSSTRDMEQAESATLFIDDSFAGLPTSKLGRLCGFGLGSDLPE